MSGDLEALVAAALDRMTLAEFAEITPRQLHDLYGHPRDEKGQIESQAETPDLTDEQADRLAMMLARTAGTAEDVARVEETIRRREEAKRDGDGTHGG